MPLYDFECEECGYRDEELLTSAESGLLLECPRCCNESYVRQVSKITVNVGEPQFGAIINNRFVPGSFEK